MNEPASGTKSTFKPPPRQQSTAMLQLTLCVSVVVKMNAECWRVDAWILQDQFHQSKTQARCAEVRDFPVAGAWRSVFRSDRVFWNEHKIWNAVTYWIAAAMFNPFSATLIALLVEFPFKIVGSMTMSQRDVKLTRTVHLESVPQRVCKSSSVYFTYDVLASPSSAFKSDSASKWTVQWFGWRGLKSSKGPPCWPTAVLCSVAPWGRCCIPASLEWVQNCTTYIMLWGLWSCLAWAVFSMCQP